MRVGDAEPQVRDPRKRRTGSAHRAGHLHRRLCVADWKRPRGTGTNTHQACRN
jgi:hypothetical protein